jgi:hypothetical protein
MQTREANPSASGYASMSEADLTALRKNEIKRGVGHEELRRAAWRRGEE